MQRLLTSGAAGCWMHLSRVCVAVLWAALGGCAGQPIKFPDTERMELTATPFFPQRTHQCGPAALATVLSAAQAEVSADELTSKVYLPGREGSLQVEMIAATRSYDRLAYPVAPRLEALLHEVAAGRPVLVLQNLALESFPAWHYAVVIGFDAQREKLVLRSGTTERLELSAAKFLRSWSRAQHWGIVILRPNELPAQPEREPYVAAAAGLEVAGRLEPALQAYHTALARWPDSTTALLGIGNVHYGRRDLSAAAQAYTQALEIDPAHPIARNNLAQVLLEQGRVQAALEQIQLARALLRDSRFATELEETEVEIRKALQ